MHWLAGFASEDGAQDCFGAGARMLEAMPAPRGGARGIFSDEGLTLLHGGPIAAGGAGGGRTISRRHEGKTVTAALCGRLTGSAGLERELEALGLSVRTFCDDELALLAFLAWGEGCSARLCGAFALAVWDGASLFLLSDRYGLRPLACVKTESGVVFATHPAALPAHPDAREALKSLGGPRMIPPGVLVKWSKGVWTESACPAPRREPPGEEGLAEDFIGRLRKACETCGGAEASFLLAGEGGNGAGRPALLPPGAERLPVVRLRVWSGGERLGPSDLCVTGQEAALGLLDLTRLSALADATPAESTGLLLCRKARRVGAVALTLAGGKSLLVGGGAGEAGRLARTRDIAAMAGLDLRMPLLEPPFLDYLFSLTDRQRAALRAGLALEGDLFPLPAGREYRHGLISRHRAWMGAPGAGPEGAPDEAALTDGQLAGRLTRRAWREAL